MDIASDTVHIIRCILLPKVRTLTSLNTRGRKSIKDKKIISITWREGYNFTGEVKFFRELYVQNVKLINY